ncbi:MAG: hypothetical protein H6730_22730 [Deltaproteobacteria bacterium]|nr:hypothetical protein [Deltaproteobacteria bacterium]
MEEPLPWQHLANATIVVEFEPQEVQHLASHAFATLVMSACAAVVLLLATVGFWRSRSEPSARTYGPLGISSSRPSARCPRCLGTSSGTRWPA